MKYRVNINLAFDKQEDAQKLIDFVKTVKSKASPIIPPELSSTADNGERPIAQWHICRHDEGKSCDPPVEI